MKIASIVSLLSTALFLSSCSSSPWKPERKVASSAEVCAKLVENIKDKKALEQLGCTAEGTSSNVFNSSSSWTKSSGEVFNEIETNGIIMTALQEAHKNCTRDRTLCVVKNISLVSATEDKNGGRVVKYEVTVHGVDSFVDNSELKKFDSTSSNNSGSQSSQLLLLSAQYTAISRALSNCYNEGYALCAVAGYNLTESNNYKEGRYHTSASASVIGLNFVRPKKSGANDKGYKLNFKIPVPTFELETSIDI